MMLPAAVADLTTRFLREVDDRLPGRLTGLLLHGSLCWGEFFAGSDVDFVGVWDELPAGDDLTRLHDAHQATRGRLPSRVFDGFHCTPADLAGPPAAIAHRPVFYQSVFDPAGTIDINPVTWHELAERGIAVRGDVPAVRTSRAELVDFTRRNLDTYWRGIAEQIDDADVAHVGANDDAVAFLGLGPARLHHLLVTGELTSKSGAGRYVRDHLSPRWKLIAEESLRLREEPGTTSLYADPAERGRDVVDLLRRLIEDGVTRGPSQRSAGRPAALP